MQINNTKTHLAFCISTFHAGGGEAAMIDLANAFAARGHSVDLLVLCAVGPMVSRVGPGVRVVTFGKGRALRALPQFMRYLLREKPATILALDEHTNLISLFARILTHSDTRIVLRIGNMYSQLFQRYHGPKYALLRMLIQKMYKRADAFVAVSDGVKDDIVAITGMDRARVHVIYNYKPLEKIRAAGREPVAHVWLERKTLPVIVAVGRLREQKNFPFLIRAFKKLLTTTPARLIIVGAGRDEEALRELVRGEGLENSVSLPGHQDNPHAWVAKADLFVSASLWEGMPNSIIEALAVGAPVIASDCDSGPREVLAPETDYTKRLGSGGEWGRFGVLYAPGDSAALVEAMREMLHNGEAWERYRKESLARAEDFGENALTKYEHVLTDTL